jgi:hypothetical protein
MTMVGKLADILRIKWRMTDDLAFAEYTALAAFHEQLQRTIESTTTRTREAGLQIGRASCRERVYSSV